MHHKSKAAFFLSILLLVLAISGCTPKQTSTFDINHLSGRTIGCILGYSSDYIITNENKDVELRRYDAYSDMMMGLAFHQLDAAAMEMDEAYVFCRMQPEYMIYGTFKTGDKYAYYLNPRTPEFNARLNAFIKDFRKTPEYQDMIKRAKASADKPFVSRHVKNTGSEDKVLTVMVYDGWEPVSYLNTATNEWEGVDIELCTYFANSIGAKIKFTPAGSFTQAVLDLSLGKVSFMACPDSLRLKEDMEKSGHVTMSDCVWEKDIVFIVNTADYKKTDRTGAI